MKIVRIDFVCSFPNSKVAYSFGIEKKIIKFHKMWWAHMKTTGQMNEMKNRFYQSDSRFVSIYEKHDGQKMKDFLENGQFIYVHRLWWEGSWAWHNWHLFLLRQINANLNFHLWIGCIKRRNNGSCYGSQPVVCYIWMKWSVCSFIISFFFFKTYWKRRGIFFPAIQVAAAITTQNTINFSIRLRIDVNVHKLCNGNKFLRKNNYQNTEKQVIKVNWTLA